MMGRLLEKRWVCVLLSILLAIAFWVYIRAAVDPNGTTQIHNVRVETTGTSVLTSAWPSRRYPPRWWSCGWKEPTVCAPT